MRNAIRWLCLLWQAALVLSLTGKVWAQAKLLDDFEDISAWKAIASEGVSLELLSEPGYSGKALALDFEFHGGSGYAIAQKPFRLDLPENYKFTFYLRGQTPPNHFEFKLLDSLGNVYWLKQLNIDYPRTWTQKAIKKRHLSFAWGPAGGGTIQKVDRIEFVVSAGTGGGKGKIWIDDFKLEAMEEAPQPQVPFQVKVSSMKPGGEPHVTPDGKAVTHWISSGDSDREWLVIDFQKERELGGLVIDWSQEDFAIAYDVDLSADGQGWSTGYAVANGNGGRDYIYLPEAEAKSIRLNLKKSIRAKGYGINRLEIKGVEFSETPNAFFTAIAAEAPRGYYPKYFLGEQTYWTVTGVSGDATEALINEYGIIEIEKSSFSLEPFLFLEGRLVTWNDVTVQQSLEQGYLPIPTVRWDYKNLQLSITALAAGEAGHSALIASYRVENKGPTSTQGRLYVAIRPFQVLPPWQALNLIGGAARIDSVKWLGGRIIVNESKVVFPLTPPDGFGAAEFDQGDITDYLRYGTLLSRHQVVDHFGYASGALEFEFRLEARQSKEVFVVVPFHETTLEVGPPMTEEAARAFADRMRNETREFWVSKLNKVEIQLPDSARDVVNTFRSNLAYILINRDGPAIQPGSRTYERSWIRDGSLTSTALLQTGNYDEVREYLDWYAPYQYPSGKIPCVVDSRGADPVPEHDSHGEFIYAVMEYYRFTHDTTWLRGKFPYVVKAVRYIQELRQQRKTPLYRHGNPEQRACYGLVPESISHEGYSAKPMHSYWDDFFVLRGLKDAAAMAELLGEKTLAEEFAAERDDFRKALYASMRLAMANQRIDFIPGCVELGDFDATSTAIGVVPGGELGQIPEPELANTFERYYRFFEQRRHNAIDWINYTPYEVRLVGAFIYLDEKIRAHELLNFFMKDRRPPGWNHWAEVVWRDASAPKFIGDMPHTWVGSDYMRSVRSMFVYEREKDSALVVGAGILQDWLRDPRGVEVKPLPTHYGTLGFKMSKQGKHVLVDLEGNLQMPPGQIVLKSPLSAKLKGVIVNGKKSTAFTPREVSIKEFPASVLLVY